MGFRVFKIKSSFLFSLFARFLLPSSSGKTQALKYNKKKSIPYRLKVGNCLIIEQFIQTLTPTSHHIRGGKSYTSIIDYFLMFSVICFHFICMSVLPACMSIHHWYACCPQRSEGVIGSLGIRVIKPRQSVRIAHALKC